MRQVEITAEQEASIGLEAGKARRYFLLHGGNDIRRADTGARNRVEPATQLDGAGRGQRRHHSFDGQRMRRQCTQDIAIDLLTVGTDEQRAVAIAVCGNDRVESVPCDLLGRYGDALRIERLGIDGDKTLRTPETNQFSSKADKDIGEEVATGG